ncbi:MAG: hypothetical protein RLZZ364_465, partial [Actinomycetota bacterium]
SLHRRQQWHGGDLVAGHGFVGRGPTNFGPRLPDLVKDPPKGKSLYFSIIAINRPPPMNSSINGPHER